MIICVILYEDGSIGENLTAYFSKLFIEGWLVFQKPFKAISQEQDNRKK